jgi:hypothetical protein
MTEADEPPADASLTHLFRRLDAVDLRVRRSVAQRRADDPTADDPFRGLYLGEADVERVLRTPLVRTAEPDESEIEVVATAETGADVAELAGARPRLRALQRAAGLTDFDVELLLIALLTDLDPRCEKLYGYLNDDVSRRRASVGMALEIAGASALDADARARLRPGAPLVDVALVAVEDEDRPLLGRSLRVPDRVVAHLLGDDRPDPMVAGLLTALPDPIDPGCGLGTTLGNGARLAYLRERTGAATRAAAAGGLLASGRSALALDLDLVEVDAQMGEIAATAAREALLAEAGLIAGPIEALVARGPDAVRAFTGLGCVVILHGRRSWDPRWSSEAALVADVPLPSVDERDRFWRNAIDGGGECEPGALSAQFLLAPESIARSVAAARLRASADGGVLRTEHLLEGARAQNGGGLERLDRRIAPGVGWDDLVLPELVRGQLHELAARAHNRTRVLDEWVMRPGGGRGRGVTALFAGDPGTGKTMAAEVIAHALGYDLYAVNLATVVDKYIGETEKNLERIFTEAEGVNGVLLFDEADALFGKRSEVSDAHDRHANVEVAYLLQRMESFDGLAVLATNLRANLDEAFSRRLDVLVDFALPDEAARRALWAACLGPKLPRADDVDLDFCARAFELSGGSIRAIAVTAAYLAADAGTPVQMDQLIQATQTEYRKLGRLVLDSEFGRWAGARSR